MNDLARKITFLFGTSVILSWASTTYSVLQITSGHHVNTSFHQYIFASVCQWFRVLIHLPNKVIVTTRSPQTVTYWTLALHSGPSSGPVIWPVIWQFGPFCNLVARVLSVLFPFSASGLKFTRFLPQMKPPDIYRTQDLSWVFCALFKKYCTSF